MTEIIFSSGAAVRMRLDQPSSRERPSDVRGVWTLVTAALAVAAFGAGPVLATQSHASAQGAALLELARKHFHEENWPAEEKLFRAAASGGEADGRETATDDVDPAKAASWRSGRMIRPERLRWLCTDPAALKLVSIRGISLSGVRIKGTLDLHGLQIPFPLQLVSCAFDGEIVLGHSQLRSLNLSGSFVKGVEADGLHVEDGINLGSGFNVEGKVELTNSTVGSDLKCTAGKFLGAADGTALDASSARVGGSVLLDNAQFEGAVIFNGATVSGIFQCDGGHFTDSKGNALNLDSIRIDRNLFLRGATFTGQVWLYNAAIGGNFECREGTFANPDDGKALIASSARIGGNVLLTTAHFEGAVIFNGATVSGIFQCDGGHFTNAKGYALNLDSIRIDRNLFLRGATFAGQVWLYNAAIGGNFECSKGIFTGSKDGALDASSAKIGSNVSLGRTQFNGTVEFVGVTIGGDLECIAATFASNPEDGRALIARSARIGGSVVLVAAHFEGAVNFIDATVSGIFQCDRGQFKSAKDNALGLDSIRIDRNLFLRGARFNGRVWLYNADIGGNFECSKGIFIGSEDGALDASSAKIGGNVLLNQDLVMRGTVRLQGATIGGDLVCEGGKFFKDGTNVGALEADSVRIMGSVFLRDHFTAEGNVSFKNGRIGHNFMLEGVDQREKLTLDLQFAKVGTFLNDRQSWPQKGNLLLHGFVYDVIDAKARPDDARNQVQWLHRQRDQFLSQPYEQLAATLRGMGLHEEAVYVMIAKNRDAGRHSNGPWNWFWYHTLGKLICYGYRPWRALLLSIVIVIIGAGLFKIGYHKRIVMPTAGDAYYADSDETELKERYPKFNALIYSLETFVPLVKLGMESHWIPNANRSSDLHLSRVVLHLNGSMLRCYLWLHIIAGWILTTLWVGGFTGLLKT
ncbi:MAG: hypothetical protein JO015_04980 [Verrucomicrobia bacterium]|nr:hypothetical protein [Verrucomicrobiota bacterium]